jgi:hypothetical protein
MARCCAIENDARFASDEAYSYQRAFQLLLCDRPAARCLDHPRACQHTRNVTEAHRGKRRIDRRCGLDNDWS